MIVGMDFGTTNSGMAVYDGRQIELLPLDPKNANPNVARTSLYITNDQTIFIGREAVNRYFSDNVGRPVKLKKVWVGEIEVYGADMYYVTDVYAWVDILSPGRLFLSIKTGLRDADYQGTVVGQFYYSLENLVSTYLSMAKMRAERLLGRELRQVVLGRPVHFANDPKGDALAQNRLLDAAFRAGYEKVYLQYEPVAAAYHYAVQMERPQNILVFDFGGGTLDITVMRLDGHKAKEVLATGGVPVAGDVFDQKLVRAKLPVHFGEGSHYFANGNWLPLPKWIFDIFSDWQRIIDLQTPKTRKLLHEIARTADRQRAVEGLVSLVENNYGLQMFDAIEQVKRRLSDDMATMIRFSGPKFRVSEMVKRSEFEQIIYAETQLIEKHLDETVRDSGLRPDQIDAVIRTGGSSNIPVFKYMLMEKFGAKKVQAIDTFSSVTSGLGVYAHGIAAGEIEAKGYTTDDLPQRKGQAKEQSVASVNLGLVQRRMQAREEEAAGVQREAQQVLALLTEGNRLLLSKMAQGTLSEETAVPLPVQITEHEKRILAAQIVSLEEPLLLATSFFRFLLTTPGHLLDLQDMGMTAADFYHFKADEYITTFGRWAQLKQQEKFLLITTQGHVRAYNMEGLVETIEGPTPLQFDRHAAGLPAAVLGANTTDELLLALDNGRAVRYCTGDLPLRGVQALNRRNGEQLTGIALADADKEVILITADGYAKRMRMDEVAVPDRPNTRGRVIITRNELRGAAVVPDGGIAWVVTDGGMVAVECGRLPLDGEGSTKSYKFLKEKSMGNVLGFLEL
jgi:hypothetical chaperone protein